MFIITPDDYVRKEIKECRYSLKLEIYEDEPYTTPNKRFMKDILLPYTVSNQKISEALKEGFEQLLDKFNLEDKGE